MFTRFTCALLAIIFTTQAHSNATDNQPLRIVTLSPQGTEMAFSAGLGDNLIGVSEHSDYPSPALDIERIANHRGINLERVVAMQPDLILTWEGGNPAQQLNKLRALGFTLYNTYPESIESIADILDDLSEWSAQPELGQQAASTYRAELRQLQQQYGQRPTVRYFFELSQEPLMTMRNDAWPGPLFELCQGENVFADSPAPYPQVNMEQVITRQPAIIFHTEDSSTDHWQRWAALLPAIADQQLYGLNRDWLFRATPRSLRAARQICDALHGIDEKQG